MSLSVYSQAACHLSPSHTHILYGSHGELVWCEVRMTSGGDWGELRPVGEMCCGPPPECWCCVPQRTLQTSHSLAALPFVSVYRCRVAPRVSLPVRPPPECRDRLSNPDIGKALPNGAGDAASGPPSWRWSRHYKGRKGAWWVLPAIVWGPPRLARRRLLPLTLADGLASSKSDFV